MRVLLIIVATSLVIFGCSRRRPSEDPPVHLVTNMDDQPKYKAQSASRFFADGISMRLPIEGTVARGSLHYDSIPFYTGKDNKGNPLRNIPTPVTIKLLNRGQQRFDIYCSPCHSRVGDGHGIVASKGMFPPPSFHEQRLIDTTAGYIFDVISNGIRNMAAYKYQVPVKDRWAIIAYIRVLQRSRRATIKDIPDNIRIPKQ